VSWLHCQKISGLEYKVQLFLNFISDLGHFQKLHGTKAYMVHGTKAYMLHWTLKTPPMLKKFE